MTNEHTPLDISLDVSAKSPDTPFNKDDHSLWSLQELDQYPRKGTYPPRILALERRQREAQLTPEQVLLLTLGRLGEDE